MVDTLLTFAQIRAALPDNSSNLISPADARNSTLSSIADVGEVGDTSSWTLALVAGVPSNINALSPAPGFEVARGWTVNINGALVPDWLGFTIPPGLERAVSASFQMVGKNAEPADDMFLVELLRGAVVVASVNYELEGGADTADALVGFNALELYEPGLGEPWSVQITSTAGNDLDLEEWDLKVRGAAV